MQRNFMLALLGSFSCVLCAQQPAAPPKVVKSEAKELKTHGKGAPAAAPTQDTITWQFTGAFDVGPAHPECATMPVQERDACTAQHVLQGILNQGTVDPVSLALVVEVSFGVNEYGEVKDIKVEGIADQRFMQKTVIAVSNMPRFAYATKAETRTGSRCLFRIPAALLTAPKEK
ncbi:MAG: hypothetical protein ABI599_16110 [Flavobacteriales bacterium]